MILIGTWGYFYRDPHNFDLENYLSALKLIGIFSGIGITIGLIGGVYIRETLRLELDENGISINGFAQPKMTIPFNKISKITESQFNALHITSETLNRTILLSTSDFDSEDYEVIKARLESWMSFTLVSNYDQFRAFAFIGFFVIYAILFPIFYSLENKTLKALPFISMAIFSGVVFYLNRNRIDAPNHKLSRIFIAFFGLISLLLTIYIVLGEG